MIDAEVKFGAYAPKVPQHYKDAAVDSIPCSSKRIDSLKQADRCLEEEANSDDGCYIGPRWTPLTLTSIIPYNHDISLFEFALPHNQSLNLLVAARMLVKAPGREHDGTHAVRPYTSTSDPLEPGQFQIMVKRYKEWGIPESKLKAENKFFFYVKTDHSYKPAGAVSNYIYSLRIGDQLEFKYTSPWSALGESRTPFPRMSRPLP
jgi:NAD(P)H-flavin reductase